MMRRARPKAGAIIPVATKQAGVRVPARLVADIRRLIEEARTQTARAVNTGLVLLNWSIGQRIRKEILKNARADYGQRIVVTLSRQLRAEYGEGFAEKNVWRMIQLAEAYPNAGILVTLSRELTWSHFVALLPLKDRLKREFYAEMCRVERWSVRTLRQQGEALVEISDAT